MGKRSIKDIFIVAGAVRGVDTVENLKNRDFHGQKRGFRGYFRICILSFDVENLWTQQKLSTARLLCGEICGKVGAILLTER